MKTFLLALVCTCSAVLSAEMVLHVDAQRGSAAGDGSVAHPFQTPVQARDAVRRIRQTGFPAEGLAVELEGYFDAPKGGILTLDKADGGPSPDRPIVWRAGAKGAFLSGACRLTARDFSPVQDEARARLRPEVRDKVYVCDLAKFGVLPLKPLPDTFNKWTEMELISAGQAGTIARYPNSGWLEITNVVDRGVAPCDRQKGEWEFGVRGGTFSYDGDFPERWNLAKGVYLFGFWCWDWASDSLRIDQIDRGKKTITTAGIHRYGLGRASKWNKSPVRYFAYNLLEELDAPGEWYVDRAARLLYFYPTAVGLDDVALSLAQRPLVSICDVTNLVVKGLNAQYSTSYAVEAVRCQNVTLDALDVSWLSQNGIKVQGGQNVTVRNCRMSQIGATGLLLWGGDRPSLTKCNHLVCHNDIGYCGRLARIGGTCCSFHGCGITIEHNYFHDTPYITMSYGGNEHLIQYNEIECAMLEASDGAGIYTGRDWGSRGNVLRWNYLHHFGQAGVELRKSQGRDSGCEAVKTHVMVEGIYLDDCDSGETIYGNLFYKIGRAMFTGGGRDNHWRQNLVVDCTTAAHLDVRGLQRARPGSGIKDGWDLLAKIEQCAYTNEPWASRYPELIGVMQKDPLLPVGTEYVSNIAVNCDCFFSHNKDTLAFLRERRPNRANVSVQARDVAREERDYPQTNAAARAQIEIRRDDLGFAAESDPRMLQDNPVFRQLFPLFPRIPVEKIGLVTK